VINLAIVFLSVYFFGMQPDEEGIIEGGSPEVPQPKGLGMFLAGEGAWILAAFAATILTASLLEIRGGTLAALAPAIALFGLHGLVGVHVLRVESEKLAGWFRFDRRAVMWGLGGSVLLLGFNGLYGLLLDALGIVPPDVAAMLRGLLPESVLFVWAAVLAPIVEELYFRGRLMDAFTPRLGSGWAGTITSLAFAAIHGIPAFFPAYVVFAFVLLALRRRTGGLVAPILAHMINNAFALFTS
jgi:membrane protease YdiL (CAAX protease family)